MILEGAFRVGERMPSLRQFSRQRKISLPTAMQVYIVLENRQLIEARPKSGFFVRPRLSGRLLEPRAASGPLEPNSLEGYSTLRRMMRDVSDPSLLPLGGAIPDDSLLPLKRLSQAVTTVLRTHPGAGTRYDPPPGSLQLRVELSKRSLEWGCRLGPDDFIITNGATEALWLAIETLTRPGDAIIVEAPTYHGLLSLLGKLQRQVIAIPSSPREGIDLELLAQTLQQRRVAAILISPNYSNPLGSRMPDFARQTVLGLAERHHVPVIEDDIYGDLPHDSATGRPHTLKALDPNVILCGSFSKTVAAGWRVGYIAAPPIWRQEMIDRKTTSSLACATLQPLALAEFLKNGGYERHLRRLRGTLREQVALMREVVARRFPAGTRVSNPSGGFVLWLELPGEIETLPLLPKARAAGISFLPGAFFSPGEAFGHCLRLNAGCLWGPAVEAAIDTLACMVREARPATAPPPP